MTILSTNRLRLEPFTESHIDGLLVVNSDPQVMRFISGRAETREETEFIVARVRNFWQKWGFSWWSFIEHESGQLVGCGCIQYLERNEANPLEIGWRLRPDKWHQGLASEAAQTMAGFAFETVKTPILLAVCHPENTASARVMERLGMHYRGLETWYETDTSVYAITRDEWASQRVNTPGRS